MKKLILILTLLLIPIDIWANCDDNIDDDGDGFTDFDGNGGTGDPGCTGTGDSTEYMSGTTWNIECNDESWVSAINDMCFVGGGITVTFNCSTTTITIDTTTWAVAARDINNGCSNNIIDGGNNITFEPDTASQWRNRSVCGGACDTNTNGIPDACPIIEETTPRFMVIRGDNNIFRNFTIQHWMDGFRFNADTNSANTGDNNTLDNITCYYPGDNCYSSEGDTYMGVGNIVKNSTLYYACDKAIQVYGRDSGWTDANDFDMKLENVSCIDSNGCIRANSNGYYILNNITVDEISPPAGQYNCDYAIYSDSTNLGGIFNINTMLVDDCNEGFGLYDDSEAYIKYVTFDNIATEAVRLQGSALAVVENCTFLNGTVTGVDLINTTQADVGDFNLDGAGITFRVMGNVKSVGRNSFAGAVTAIDNNSSNTVLAENNCWDDADPSNEVTGTGVIDYTPVATESCPTPLYTPSVIKNSLIRNGRIGR